MDWVNTEVTAAGGWVGDQLGAAPDASAVHSADPVAATAPPAPADTSLLGSIGHTLGDFGRGVQQEGLGALLDPSGAVDRQEAQHELAARFNVVAAGTPGAGNENTVTQEQFQQIAREYSDIRMDRSDVHVNTAGRDDDAAKAFKQGTMNDIASMMQTNSGRALLDDLNNAKNKDGTERQTYISAISDDDFTNKGGRGGGRFGGAAGAFDSDKDHKEGYVYYRPGQVALPGNADARSDVALMHELTHADASVHDRFASGAVTAADGATPADVAGGVSRSEYQAAGMGTFASTPFNENAYRRDRAAIGASGSGARDDQGKSDTAMPQRSTYLDPTGGTSAGGGSLGAGGGAHDEPALPGYEEG